MFILHCIKNVYFKIAEKREPPTFEKIEKSLFILSPLLLNKEN